MVFATPFSSSIILFAWLTPPTSEAKRQSNKLKVVKLELRLLSNAVRACWQRNTLQKIKAHFLLTHNKSGLGNGAQIVAPI